MDCLQIQVYQLKRKFKYKKKKKLREKSLQTYKEFKLKKKTFTNL